MNQVNKILKKRWKGQDMETYFQKKSNDFLEKLLKEFPHLDNRKK